MVADPRQQGVLGRSFAVMGVIGLAGCALGAFLVSLGGVLAWVLIGVGALTALVGFVMWRNGVRASQLSGDDLIDLIVMPDGFITQGGFGIGWSEVSRVCAVEIRTKRVRGNRHVQRAGRTIGTAAGKALFDRGANIRIDIHLPDCKAALARATSKTQKLALVDDIGQRSGKAQAMLGLRSAEEIGPLLEILRRECRTHGVPYEETTEVVGL